MMPRSPMTVTFAMSCGPMALMNASAPLVRDRVQAVSADGSTLVLQTQYSGSVAYSDVKAFN